MNSLETLISPCPETLTDDQIMQYQTEGYLAFTDVLTPSEVEKCRQALRRVAKELSESKESQYLSPKAEKDEVRKCAVYRRPNSRSMIQLEGGFDPEGKSFDEIEIAVRKHMHFCDEDEVFQKIVSAGSRLHGVVSSLIGANPILSQQMALVKPAFIGSEKPWHQDAAYFSVSPINLVAGVWIALDDAGVENGCMHVIPGGHLEGGFKHHHGSDCEIDPNLLAVNRAVPVPLPTGGAMFFHCLIPHETPPNRSAQRRRALQFHYRGAETKIVDETVYDTLFVDRLGAPSSCRAASRLGF